MNSTVFPIPMDSHIIFCVISVIFFAIQYIRFKHTYHLILGIAIPATLLIYANSNEFFFFGVGVLEAILMILTCVFVIKQKKIEKNTEINAASSDVSVMNKDE